MPTYSYECECGASQEIFRSIHDESEVICESCNENMKKKLSAPSVSFKGSGFYSTDK